MKKPPNPNGNPAWAKGCKSPNPTGRPKSKFKSLAAVIAEDCDPRTLYGFMMAVAAGMPLAYYVDEKTNAPTPCLVADLPAGANVVEYLKPTTTERMRAVEFLADRAGWFVPKQVDVHVTASSIPRPDYSKLSDEQLDTLIKLTEIATADVPALSSGEEDDDVD